MSGAAAVAVLATALILAASARAAGDADTFTVAGFEDGSGACTAPDSDGNSVCPSLRAAVVQAGKQTNVPTIDLLPGTYQLTPGNGGQLDLATSMNIVGAGPGGPDGTTIEQTDGQDRVLEVDGSSELTGLEITGGRSAPAYGTIAHGGGILVLGVLALQDGRVDGNQAVGAAGPSTGKAGENAVGGGIDYAAGAPPGSAITDSTISGNKAVGGAGGIDAVGGTAMGGGVAYEATGSLGVQSSTISQNATTGGVGGSHTGGGASGGDGDGGGVFNSGSLTMVGSTVAGNTAVGGGQGSPASSTASGGAGGGGGIFSRKGAVTLVNITVFDNAAEGGAPAQAGTAGSAQGGGALAEGSASGAALQSDTFDANQPGDLYIAVGTSPPYPFTVHDTIIGTESSANCVIDTPPSSESYNLEVDSADSCGFSSANHDLVGVDPQLPNSLGDNGGPTQTLAPAPGSPVLGAGGTCLAPTTSPPGQPLTTDQRGQPRSLPCDIGAFEAQRPSNAVRPAISGTTTRGQTLTCSEGSWRGDGPLDLAFQWLRNGVPIQGAVTSTYILGRADPGQSVACAVTATHYGSVTARSRFVTVRSYPRITLLRVAMRDGSVIVSLGCRGVSGQRCGGALVLAATEPLHAGAVTLLRHRYRVRARHAVTLRLRLGRGVLRLLHRVGALRATLSLRQTTAAGTTAIASRRMRLRAPA